MSRIELEQISDNEIEVLVPAETPVEVFEDLKKGLLKRGLVENLVKSTVGVRYFYRPQDSTNAVADELIKSLKSLAKEDDPPYFSPEAQRTHRKMLAERDVQERRAKLGIGKPAAEPAAPGTVKPKMYDSHPAAQATAGGTGKRYGYITDPVHKDEDPDCECETCQVEKSGYGPKGTKLYSPEDNARRKARNLSDQVNVGPNVNVKSYSTRPGQISGKEQAAVTARRQAALNRKQPVRTMKDMSPQEVADLKAKYNKPPLKKGWADHLPFPNAEHNDEPVESGEDVMANQLATMMNSKAMLNPNFRQPSSEDMIMAGEMMGIGAVPEMIKSGDQQWTQSINNFYREAAKPISQRFSSEEEEMAYWSSIKVADSDDGKSGY